MPIALLLIGALLIIVAFQNTMGQLAAELESDIPGFFVWAIAIAAILGLGYVPGFKTPSRWLLGLVVLVVVLVNYKTILSGFTNFATTGSSATAAGAAATPANPSTVFAAAGTPPAASDVSGTATGSTTGSGAGSSASSSAIDPLTGLPSSLTNAAGNIASGAISGIANYLNPSSYVSAVGGGLGLGGLSGELF
jgi:hypothetical protein